MYILNFSGCPCLEIFRLNTYTSFTGVVGYMMVFIMVFVSSFVIVFVSFYFTKMLKKREAGPYARDGGGQGAIAPSSNTSQLEIFGVKMHKGILAVRFLEFLLPSGAIKNVPKI